MLKLEGKVALVTGASGGIGRGIAVRLAREGANVMIHYGSNRVAGQETAQLVEQEGSEADLVQADLASYAGVESLFAAVDRRGDGIDILVNNAGAGLQKPIDAVTEEDYDGLFALNTKSYFFCMQQAGRRMTEGGRIVNISSGIARAARPMTALYAASRGAIYNFTAVAAQEFGSRGITVNSVSPGPVEPGLVADMPEHVKDAMRSQSPFNRLGTPEDVADIVAFLVSDDARWVTGQDVLATGGYIP